MASGFESMRGFENSVGIIVLDTIPPSLYHIHDTSVYRDFPFQKLVQKVWNRFRISIAGRGQVKWDWDISSELALGVDCNKPYESTVWEIGGRRYTSNSMMRIAVYSWLLYSNLLTDCRIFQGQLVWQVCICWIRLPLFLMKFSTRLVSSPYS